MSSPHSAAWHYYSKWSDCTSCCKDRQILLLLLSCSFSNANTKSLICLRGKRALQLYPQTIQWQKNIFARVHRAVISSPLQFLQSRGTLIPSIDANFGDTGFTTSPGFLSILLCSSSHCHWPSIVLLLMLLLCIDIDTHHTGTFSIQPSLYEMIGVTHLWWVGWVVLDNVNFNWPNIHKAMVILDLDVDTLGGPRKVSPQVALVAYLYTIWVLYRYKWRIFGYKWPYMYSNVPP